MSMIADSTVARREVAVFRAALSPIVIMTIAALAEFAIIVAMAVLSGLAYRAVAYRVFDDAAHMTEIGLVVACLYVFPHILNGSYSVSTYVANKARMGRQLAIWSYAFLCLGLVAYLTKTTAVSSRGSLTVLFVAGFVALLITKFLIARVMVGLLKAGHVRGRRILIVGTPADAAAMDVAVRDAGPAFEVVKLEQLTGPGATSADAAREIAHRARSLRIDDVIIAVPMTEETVIRDITEAFIALPVAIHLGLSGLFYHSIKLKVSDFASRRTLVLAAPPLSRTQLLVKRLADFATALVGLIVLAPFFLVIAAGIKASSPGPVFFRQRRSGYNCQEFKIWKFRTMTVTEDGDDVVQAQRNDARITRFGAWLRRYNIDELPQLINVVLGEMSIVGPRPHAIAHDAEFAERVASYSRRLNVQPGMTGWAQVNGFRGPTTTAEALEGRIECDLYYIENWSISFDLYIVGLTLVSPRAFVNAY